MQLDSATDALDLPTAGGSVDSYRPPPWLHVIDRIVIALLNAALVAEVAIVFANTLLRSLFSSSLLMGFDETSSVFLIMVAFLGGAVSYGRGQFIAITLLVDKAPAAARSFFAAAVEWIVVLTSLLIGGYSIPLLMINAEETTVLLGIGYAWMTVPITLGCALFVLHAGLSLSRRPIALIAGAGALVGAVVLVFVSLRGGPWAHGAPLFALLAALFLVQIAIAVPIGFVLGVVGIACVYTVGSADMMAVVMNAQRGSGGFIFLALPFFILAGFITDRGDIGARIVDFVASMIGHVRGGLLQVMIVGVYISSGISGSKAADMATIGIPMNKRLGEHGYPPHERAALLAASAAMGESVPPSIAIILLGSVTSVSTGALFIGGFLPAATVAAFLALLVYVRARFMGWHPRPRAPLAEVARTGRRAILPLLMPVVLIGGIVAGIGTPTEVSTFAVVYGLGLGLVYRLLGLRSLGQILTEATLLNGMIFFTVSAATIFSWALTLEGMTGAIAAGIGALGKAAFLPAVIVVTVLLGALLESFVTIIILGPLLLPVAMQLGVNPLQYGIVMVEAFGIGSILPPIGIALYVACTICGAKVERTSVPLLWYLAVMFVSLLLVAAFPSITTALPTFFNFKS
ncbi:MAG: TRAP transporter large permease subunit [Alphaproteobacteria bacterium]|nr:TRAP transporter large permease subunit [Alphaproteobacteria bacterium]